MTTKASNTDEARARAKAWNSSIGRSGSKATPAAHGRTPVQEQLSRRYWEEFGRCIGLEAESR